MTWLQVNKGEIVELTCRPVSVNHLECVLSLPVDGQPGDVRTGIVAGRIKILPLL